MVPEVLFEVVLYTPRGIHWLVALAKNINFLISTRKSMALIPTRMMFFNFGLKEDLCETMLPCYTILTLEILFPRGVSALETLFLEMLLACLRSVPLSWSVWPSLWNVLPSSSLSLLFSCFSLRKSLQVPREDIAPLGTLDPPLMLQGGKLIFQ